MTAPHEPEIIAYAMRPQRALRMTGPAFTPIHEEGRVVVEQPLTITIDGVGTYTLMCSPSQTAELAVGFAFSEGIITSLGEIDLLYHCDDDPTAVRLRLGSVPEARPERNLIVSSACGMCGNTAIDALLTALPSVEHTLTVPAAVLLSVQEAMRRCQPIFAQTGGTHAAALFNRQGEIMAFAEDIGRHNALDKCIGHCLLAGQTTAGCGVALSGRASLEMVVKAARAGIEVLGAVSAPSSLAIDAAERSRITLCGFVRQDRLTVYSHPARLVEAGNEEEPRPGS